MSYTPKNNFNLQLKRTGTGEVGFRKKLWKTLAGTCDALDYYFRWEPLYEGLSRSDFKTIEVAGGIGDFNWSIIGAGFTLDNAVTAERTNVVRSDGTIFTGDNAVVTVIDSCGISVEGGVKGCYASPGGEARPTAWYPVTSSLNGTLISVEIIDNVCYYLINVDWTYPAIYTWDGSDFTRVSDQCPYCPFGEHRGNDATSIGNTIYFLTDYYEGYMYKLAAWTIGNTTITYTNCLDMRAIVAHDGFLWGVRHTVNKLYKLVGSTWTEICDVHDGGNDPEDPYNNAKSLYHFHTNRRLVSHGGFLYWTGMVRYRPSPYRWVSEIRKYLGSGASMILISYCDAYNSQTFTHIAEKDNKFFSGGEIKNGSWRRGFLSSTILNSTDPIPVTLLPPEDSYNSIAFILVFNDEIFQMVTNRIDSYDEFLEEWVDTGAASFGTSRVSSIGYVHNGRLYAALQASYGSGYLQIWRWGE